MQKKIKYTLKGIHKVKNAKQKEKFINKKKKELLFDKKINNERR